MSEQIDMVEVKTEPNESSKLFSVCKNTNMVSKMVVSNHSKQYKVPSDCKNHSSFRLL